MIQNEIFIKKDAVIKQILPLVADALNKDLNKQNIKKEVSTIIWTPDGLTIKLKKKR